MDVKNIKENAKKFAYSNTINVFQRTKKSV